MSTITRRILPESFKMHLLTKQKIINKKEFCKEIDFWKNILFSQCMAKPGESIFIAFQPVDEVYFAIFFAAAELRLQVVINDYDLPEDRDIVDPKTELLSPIDILLYWDDKNLRKKPNNDNTASKISYFMSQSKRSYPIQKYNQYDRNVETINVWPKNNDILMLCTSSGTTGKPKIVRHTHNFLYQVGMRNRKYMAPGNTLHSKNLMHGSSVAVYFLPAFMSKKQTQYVYLITKNLVLDGTLIGVVNSYNISNVFFPYVSRISYLVDYVKNNNVNFNAHCYILSYITDDIKRNFKDTNIPSITSIFGSNETSGPVLLNQINQNNIDTFDNKAFYAVDNFYQLSTKDNNQLKLVLPVYNTPFEMNDIFEHENGYYCHKGRLDSVKIDGNVVSLNFVHGLTDELELDGKVVSDEINDRFYLALWSEQDSQDRENAIHHSLIDRTNVGLHAVEILDKEKFMSGIKIDNERIREYFRRKYS